jgi:hypothetical protein
MKCTIPFAAVSAAVLIMSAGTAFAVNRIDSVRIEPASIKAGATVTITVTGDEAQGNNCGFRINYGDGQGLDVKVVDRGQFPRTFTKAYANPGNYTVSVEGKRVTTHFPCDGRASATLVVEGLQPPPAVAAPAPAPAAVPAPACCQSSGRRLRRRLSGQLCRRRRQLPMQAAFGRRQSDAPRLCCWLSGQLRRPGWQLWLQANAKARTQDTVSAGSGLF